MNNLILNIVAVWVSLGSQLWGAEYHKVGLIGRTREERMLKQRGKLGYDAILKDASADYMVSSESGIIFHAVLT